MGGRFDLAIWHMARGRWAAVAALSLLVAASEGVGFVLLVPLLAGMTGGEGAIAGLRLALGPLLALFVALVAVRSAAELARALATQGLTVHVVDGLRRRALAALVRAEWKALARMRQAENRALLISTVDRVAFAVTQSVEVLRLALGVVALALAALAIAPLAALAGAVAALAAMALHAGLRRRARVLGEALSRNYAAIYTRLEEALDSLRLIKSFGREARSLEDADRAFAGLRQSERGYILASGLARAALQTGAALALALGLWLAVERWGAAPATLLPLVALAVRAVPMLAALQQAAQDWNHAAPALDEAMALIGAAEAAAEPQPSPAAPRLTRAIELDGVSLAHGPGRPALAGISATIPALAITALTGPSGAGKSTLADVVGGLLAPDSGCVRIDGAPLAGGARTAWRTRVAYVQQEAVLFAGTVRDNLLWAAPTANEDALMAALERAAAGFVLALPGGLDCDLGAAGRALSGGERQRLALARALLRDPDLLILDEATSALDDDSEQAIAQAVAALVGRCTVLVIGHRGALTALARHRIALDHGRLAFG